MSHISTTWLDGKKQPMNRPAPDKAQAIRCFGCLCKNGYPPTKLRATCHDVFGTSEPIVFDSSLTQEVLANSNACALDRLFERTLQGIKARTSEKVKELRTGRSNGNPVPKSIFDLAGKKFSASGINGNFATGRRGHV